MADVAHRQRPASRPDACPASLPFDPALQDSPRGNRILASLSSEEFNRLRPHLAPVRLLSGEKLRLAGDEPTAVFPVRAVLCLQAPHSDGCAVSFASVGREGCLGFDLLSASSWSQATAAIGGLAYLLPAPELRAEFERHGELAKQMIAHGNVLVAQAAILCACNRRHVLEQQLARWLLVMLDRSPGNELVATQEMIAGLLGVRREGVTEGARRLQYCGLIEYRRGRIFVRERAALAARACECYRAIRAQLERLFEN
jgi:CRP-like cAMP-binding protein